MTRIMTTDIREAASGSLIADLAALYQRSDAARDLTMRELIDHLALRKRIVVIVALNLMPGASRRRVPWCAAEILDEISRRRACAASSRGRRWVGGGS
jgi:hypothetical protein